MIVNLNSFPRWISQDLVLRPDRPRELCRCEWRTLIVVCNNCCCVQEIQAQRPSLLVVEEAEQVTGLSIPTDITARLSSTSNTCSSLQAAPSPDEAVIVARGRRSLPLTFSPDVRVSPVTRTRPATVVSSRLMLPATR